MAKRRAISDAVRSEIRGLKAEGKKYKEIQKIIGNWDGREISYQTIAHIARIGKNWTKKSKILPRKKKDILPKAEHLVDEIMEYVRQMHGVYLDSLLMIRAELIRSRGEVRELEKTVKEYKKQHPDYKESN